MHTSYGVVEYTGYRWELHIYSRNFKIKFVLAMVYVHSKAMEQTISDSACSNQSKNWTVAV
jgi:hypothetical protein